MAAAADEYGRLSAGGRDGSTAASTSPSESEQRDRRLRHRRRRPDASGEDPAMQGRSRHITVDPRHEHHGVHATNITENKISKHHGDHATPAGHQGRSNRRAPRRREETTARRRSPGSWGPAPPPQARRPRPRHGGGGEIQTDAQTDIGGGNHNTAIDDQSPYKSNRQLSPSRTAEIPPRRPAPKSSPTGRRAQAQRRRSRHGSGDHSTPAAHPARRWRPRYL